MQWITFHFTLDIIPAACKPIFKVLNFWIPLCLNLNLSSLSLFCWVALFASSQIYCSLRLSALVCFSLYFNFSNNFMWTWEGKICPCKIARKKCILHVLMNLRFLFFVIQDQESHRQMKNLFLYWLFVSQIWCFSTWQELFFTHYDHC